MSEKRWLEAAILLTMFLLSGWVSSQFGQLTGREPEAFVATNYQFMAVGALFVAMAASIHFGFFKFEGLNKDIRQSAPLLVLGGVVGFIVTSSGKLFLTKLLSGSGSIDPTLGFTFVVILAVFVEEFFFRGALFPSIENFLGGRTNGIFATVGAVIIASALFAIWHIVATGGDETRLAGEFIFSVIQIGLLKATGSLATPIGAHFARNLITGG